MIVNQNLFICKSVGDLRIKYRKKIENVKIALKKKKQRKKRKKTCVSLISNIIIGSNKNLFLRHPHIDKLLTAIFYEMLWLIVLFYFIRCFASLLWDVQGCRLYWAGVMPYIGYCCGSLTYCGKGIRMGKRCYKILVRDVPCAWVSLFVYHCVKGVQI